MLPRPTFRMPLWSVFAVLGAAYAVRSILRGGDWRPDMPMDLLVMALAVLAVVLVGVVRHGDARQAAIDSPEMPLGVRDGIPGESESEPGPESEET